VKYVKVINGQAVEYPYTLVKLRADNPDTSFPREMGAGLLAEYGVYPVTLTEKPAPTLTQNPTEQTPQLINGVWTQTWGMVDVSAEEAEKRQIKADAFVQNFIAMTPAQVEAYVENNTGNLAQTRALLNKMALMLLALARREYR
jgi:hypothetical protein